MGSTGGVQAPPANTSLVSFLGSQWAQDACCWRWLRAARAGGVAPAGVRVGGEIPPPQPQSLLGSRMLGDPMTTDTGGAKRDSSMGHHHPCPDHHLILNCHTWGLFSPPPKGWPLGWACEHQRISHGRETEAGRGQYWLPNTHQSLGPHCLPPVSPPPQGIQKYICVMEG